MPKEPVLLNGTFAALFAALTPVLVNFGISASSVGRYGSFAGAAATVVLTFWHLFSARSKVTPVKGGSLVVHVEGEAANAFAALKGALEAVPAAATAPPPAA